MKAIIREESFNLGVGLGADSVDEMEFRSFDHLMEWVVETADSSDDYTVVLKETDRESFVEGESLTLLKTPIDETDTIYTITAEFVMSPE